MNLAIKEELIKLFESRFNEEVISLEALPPSGSYREYYRMRSYHYRVIGACNADIRENTAFLKFSEHLLKSGIAVPEIYAVNDAGTCYLQEDLGNLTLFDYLSQERMGKEFPAKLVDTYREVLRELPRIQVVAGKNIDYRYCYPRQAFDGQSMMWDLNYFKYYFLKLARIPFDEQKLEDDFQALSEYLLSTKREFFLYRDFQSRNIMLRDNGVAFIDYQGGRKGALQYDIASLLYDAKADIPQDVRDKLLDFYLGELEKYIDVDRNNFKAYYEGYVLIRIMQAMGAYGFRGFYEKKEHFLKSIPFAIDNLAYILKNNNIPVQLPELFTVLKAVSESVFLKEKGAAKNILTVRITSFSYKKGLPSDPSGNGGGFIFDCRAVNNPGKYDQYKAMTGKDQEVIDFLESGTDMPAFMEHVFALIDQSVHSYLARGFTHLHVGFGCTGGQHRSVYAAEKAAARLSRGKFPIRVVLYHREIDT